MGRRKRWFEHAATTGVVVLFCLTLATCALTCGCSLAQRRALMDVGSNLARQVQEDPPLTPIDWITYAAGALVGIAGALYGAKQKRNLNKVKTGEQ